MKKCPIGTYRLDHGAKSVNECWNCPDKSYNDLEGQASCIVCGRGSTNAVQNGACECIGAFRVWRKTTNDCVCQSGYVEPVTT